MRKSECDEMIAQLQRLVAEGQVNDKRLAIIGKILKADPNQLESLEKALSGKSAGKDEEEETTDLSAVSIDDAGFTPQLKGHLKKRGFSNLAEVKEKGESGLRKEHHFKDGSIANIRAVLKRHGHVLPE